MKEKNEVQEVLAEQERFWRGCIYHCPLPKRRPRVIPRAERPGKVKIYSKEEIAAFARERGLTVASHK